MNPPQSPDSARRFPFDLAVCYRIYPGVSRTPIFGFREKLHLARLSLETFRSAIGSLKLKVSVLLDRCPPAYADLMREIFDGHTLELIPLGGEGNEATFLRQIQLLSTQTDAEHVYIAEDDYLYLPGALETGLKFMRAHPEAEFVTLYDHLDFHKLWVHRPSGPKVEWNSQAWRTVASTCLTFMARHDALTASASVFRTYAKKNSDFGLWLALTKVGVRNPLSPLLSLRDGPFVSFSHFLSWRHCAREILFGAKKSLWAPTPGLATHMEVSGLAPGVDWSGLFGARADELKRG